jgi:hypothetical protein
MSQFPAYNGGASNRISKRFTSRVPVTGRYLIASAVVLAGAVASVSGAASWASKPYNTWTDVELKEVLNDSPWASKGGITYNQTKGGSPSAIEDVALVSWVSGMPMRQAAVRQQLGATPTPSKEAEPILAQSMNFYLVSVKISGGNSSSSYGNNAAKMQPETFLLREGKPPIAAIQSEGRVIDKDGKIVETPAPPPRGGAPGAPGAPTAPATPAPAAPSQQMRILPTAAQRGGGGFGGGGGGGFGAPQGGGNRSRGVASVMIYVFPKTDAITIDDKEVEFVTKLCGGFGGGFGGGGGRGAAAPAAGAGGGASCQFNVKKKFKLKDMMYNGELAL